MAKFLLLWNYLSRKSRHEKPITFSSDFNVIAMNKKKNKRSNSIEKRFGNKNMIMWIGSRHWYGHAITCVWLATWRHINNTSACNCQQFKCESVTECSLIWCLSVFCLPHSVCSAKKSVLSPHLLLRNWCLHISICATSLIAECGPDSTYNDCGSACTMNCENPIPPEVCTTECVAGCFCNLGYLKNSLDVSVPAGHCKILFPYTSMWNPLTLLFLCCAGFCGDTKVYNACGSACPARCGDTEPRPCTQQCVAGCVCRPDRVLGPFDRCVLPSQCEFQSKSPSTIFANHLCSLSSFAGPASWIQLTNIEEASNKCS